MSKRTPRSANTGKTCLSVVSREPRRDGATLMNPPPWRLYLTVAASAIVVYLGALGNGFALDDVPIIATNPLVHRWYGLLEAFRAPYWPATAGAAMYRPLTMASFALDWQTGRMVWLHAANLLWHAGVSVLVSVLA